MMEPWEHVQAIAPAHFEKDWMVSMFTGLLDKNGKEIYDGDVLRYGTSPVYQVKMNYSAWSAICKTENGTASVLLHNREKLFEVIGNIYENGNLLDNGK